MSQRKLFGIIASGLLVLAFTSCGSDASGSKSPKLVAHNYYSGDGASTTAGVEIYTIDGVVKGAGTDYKVKVVGSHRAYVLIQQTASTLHRALPDKQFVKKSPLTYRYHCKQKCSINVTAQLWCKPRAQQGHCAPGSEIPKGRIEVWIWRVK